MASHLGLRSLTMSHLWDARLKWVKVIVRFIEISKFDNLQNLPKDIHIYHHNNCYLIYSFISTFCFPQGLHMLKKRSLAREIDIRASRVWHRTYTALKEIISQTD